MAGTPGVSLPRVLPPEFGAHTGVYGQTHASSHPSEPQPPQPPPPPQGVYLKRANCFVASPVEMDHSVQHSSGAAKRRKQRRVRSWWRHEQVSIAAAIATALHHSVQRGGGVVRRPTGTEDSGNREGGSLSRRCPSRSVRQARSVTWLPGLLSSGVVRNCWPTRLPRPSMVGPSGTSSRRTLPGRRRRRRTQLKTSQLQQHGPIAGAASSSRSVRRKRKKRSKKKLPKAPLPRCGRPCAPSATSSSSRKCAQIQFIYDLWTFLLCSRDRYPQCSS